MKQARKVALISVFDYPRELYRAQWEIQVDGDDGQGYRWRAKLSAFDAPVGWLWQGKVTAERPDGVPWPIYPPDLPARAPKEAHDARIALCAQIYEAHPKPVYDLEHSHDGGWSQVFTQRDAADTEAQQWVLARIEQYRVDAPPLSDELVAVLVAQLDVARQTRDFAAVDQLRGRLRAHGIVLAEPQRAGDPTPTTWTRKE